MAAANTVSNHHSISPVLGGLWFRVEGFVSNHHSISPVLGGLWFKVEGFVINHNSISPVLGGLWFRVNDLIWSVTDEALDPKPLELISPAV